MTSPTTDDLFIRPRDQRRVVRLTVSELDGIRLLLNATAEAIDRGDSDLLGMPVAQGIRNLAKQHRAWIERALKQD